MEMNVISARNLSSICRSANQTVEECCGFQDEEGLEEDVELEDDAQVDEVRSAVIQSVSVVFHSSP